MSNISVSNNDNGSVVLKNLVDRDDLLTFAGAATVIEGTILARDSVSKNLVPFVKGGSTNENGIPKAVITYEVVATGAGDIPVKAGISGEFYKQRLVIDADGDDTNIDADVINQLQDFSLIAVDSKELNILDNQ